MVPGYGKVNIMAKKEQCNICKRFQNKVDLCTAKWEQPNYDGESCEQFEYTINVACSEQSNNKIEGTEENLVSNIKKRTGGLGSPKVHIEGQTNETDNCNSRTLTFSKNTHRFFNIFVFLFLIIVGYLGYQYVKEQIKAEEKEDIVWLAICELETLANDKTIDYLKLNDIKYEEQILKLYYTCKYPSNEVTRIVKDSMMVEDFLSYIFIEPNRWDSISKHLTEAEVDLQIIYTNTLIPSFKITSKELVNIINSNDKFKKGIDLFVSRKKKEILDYAKIHFRKDRYLKVDSVSIDNDYVYLHLSYNASKYNLGKTYTDTTNVNSHFVDKVGEMGSILDNMLAICSRTKRGFGFIYSGGKSYKAKSCFWDFNKVQKYIDESNNKISLESDKTNQVSTIVVRRK